MYAKIIGTGSYLPKKVVTNDDLSEIVDTSDEWIKQRVGISSRRFAATNETTRFMAEQACLQALEMADIDPSEIGLVIVATASSDYIMPSTACCIQSSLKIPSCPSFDISAACGGFIYAAHIAKQFIDAGSVQKALVVASERISRLLNWKDRNTCVLFGDGAGAVVLAADDKPGIICSSVHSNGDDIGLLNVKNSIPCDLYDNKIKPAHMYMEGQQVFKKAVKSLSGLVTELLDKANLDKSDIDWLVPHQANYRILQAAAKKLNMPMEKVIVTLDHHGNTSAASVPLALDNAIRSGKIKSGDTVLLEAFGAGFVWGGAILTI